MIYDPHTGWREPSWTELPNPYPFKQWDLNPITESSSFLEDLTQIIKDYSILEKEFSENKKFYKLKESMARVKRKYKIS